MKFREALLKKQGQKLVLSDALPVQSQGYQGQKVSSPKVVLGSQKNVLGPQEMICDLKNG